MNHRFRGRTWSDNPEPEQVRRDPYLIERVSLLVAKGASRGRWEAFTNSRPLLSRFHSLANSGLSLLGLQIGGVPIPATNCTALSIYLQSCKGLKYFRRGKVVCSTRADAASLLSHTGLNSHHVSRLQPTIQASA